MDQQALDKKMSALRLGEATRTSGVNRHTAGVHYQVTSSQLPAYGYTNLPSKAHCESGYSHKKEEGIYANLEELTGKSPGVRYQDSFIPPPEQFSQSLVQVSHVPTQSKVSLEEAMRYTPPNLVPHADEAPVYENIQFYTSPKRTPPSTSFSNTSTHQTYQPIPSNVAVLQTDARYPAQQPFEQTPFPPPSAAMKCKSFVPSYPAPQIIRPSPQRFSQPLLPQVQHYAGQERTPQRIMRQAGPSQDPSIQTSPAGSSPKIPLAVLPSKKVNLVIVFSLSRELKLQFFYTLFT